MKTTDDEDLRSMPKIEIAPSLYQKLQVKAKDLGFVSTQEFIVRLLDESVRDDGPAQIDSSKKAEEAVRKRLQGLGYLG